MKKIILFWIVCITLNISCKPDPIIYASSKIIVTQDITYDDFSDYILTTIVTIEDHKCIMHIDYGTKEVIDSIIPIRRQEFTKIGINVVLLSDKCDGK